MGIRQKLLEKTIEYFGPFFDIELDPIAKLMGQDIWIASKLLDEFEKRHGKFLSVEEYCEYLNLVPVSETIRNFSVAKS